VLHLNDLGVYITIEAELSFLTVSRDEGALLGADWTTKTASTRRTPKCPPCAAAGAVGYGENCTLEFAMPEMKKGGKEAATIGKTHQEVEYHIK
jgi:hypothetical protein